MVEKMDKTNEESCEFGMEHMWKSVENSVRLPLEGISGGGKCPNFSHPNLGEIRSPTDTALKVKEIPNSWDIYQNLFSCGKMENMWKNVSLGTHWDLRRKTWKHWFHGCGKNDGERSFTRETGEVHQVSP